MKTYQYKILIFFGRCFKILAVGIFILTVFTGLLAIIFKEAAHLSKITFLTAIQAIVIGFYNIILTPEERTVIQADEKGIMFRRPSRKPTFSLRAKEIIVKSSWQEIEKVVISPQSWRKEAKVSVLTSRGNFSFNFILGGYSELVEMLKTNVAPEKIILIPIKNIKNISFIFLCVLNVLLGLFLLFVVFCKK